jgi:excisionase family DNA binding protein
MGNGATEAQVEAVQHRRAPTKKLNSTERLLDVDEAAGMLSVSPKTIYDWAYQRRLPVVKLFGRALRFRERDLLALIDRSQRPALRAAQ